MAAAQRPWAADLLHYWFHELRPHHWFGRSSVVDEALRRRFSHQLTAFGHRPVGEFLSDRETARAAVLLFDQIPRNLFRDDPRAFAWDALACSVCKEALARGWDKGLDRYGKHFLAMPLMHSEAIADQRLSLRTFAAFENPFILNFARDHHRMIARFGRFPHRNPVLGRTSTPAEARAVAAGNSW